MITTKRVGKVRIVEDKENKTFTISTIEKGGPIISGSSFEDAVEKFKEALDLSVAVRNLNIYNRKLSV